LDGEIRESKLAVGVASRRSEAGASLWESDKPQFGLVSPVPLDKVPWSPAWYVSVSRLRSDPDWEEDMLGALVAAGGLGLLLGLRYRVPAALAASVVAAIAVGLIALITGASGWAVLAGATGAAVALQVGYVGGLLLAFAAASRGSLSRRL
jgi:hypothetical protein